MLNYTMKLHVISDLTWTVTISKASFNMLNLKLNRPLSCIHHLMFHDKLSC